MGRIEGYRNFCNKLWNATRYVLLSMDSVQLDANESYALSLPDRWIHALLQQTIQQVNQHLQTYRFDLAAQCLYELTWNEYCDWYVEFSKPVLQATEISATEQRGTRYTLVNVLETLLRLLHPFIPFITEELWQSIASIANKKGETIMLQPYPQAQLEQIDTQAIQEIEWLKQVVLGVRRIRAEMDIAPGKPLPLLCQNGTAQDQQRLQMHHKLLTTLARLESITALSADTIAPESAIALVGEMRVLIPLAGLIDKEAELNRLSREIEKLCKELEKCSTKLNNPNFTARAPAEIVAKEQKRATDMQSSLVQLEQQAARIRQL
jgi:valyl-tRNA synthetase